MAVTQRGRIGEGSRGTILVTGGAGYVGSHIVKALALAGYRPLIYDNFTTGSSSVVNWGHVERGDMTDAERLRTVIAAHKPLAVIHAATSPGMAQASMPKAAYESIVIGSLNLLDAMRDAQISMICLIASAALYGGSADLGLTEQAPVRPLTAYGASLAAVETMISDFSLAGDLRWVSLRLFSAAGADPDLASGPRITDARRLISGALDAAAGYRNHVPIYGSHFATRDGTALRDYIHVTDIADVSLRSLEGLFSNRAAGPYNIGTGRDHSVFDVIHAVERITGRKPALHYEAKKADEPPMLSADPSRAQTELLWTPSFSSLDRIVATEWAYRQMARQAGTEAGILSRAPSHAGVPVPDRADATLSGERSPQMIHENSDAELLKKLDDFLGD